MKLSAYKKSFFDRQKVATKVEKARLKNLAKCGAFVRRRARSSMRRRKKVSPPGQPPSAHSKDAFATLKNILFGYDPRRKTVIVGPVAIYGNKQGVPRLMEQGGNVQRRRRYVPQYTKTGKRKKLELRELAKPETVHYAPRPFMGPALMRERKNFAKVWKNSIR